MVPPRINECFPFHSAVSCRVAEASAAGRATSAPELEPLHADPDLNRVLGLRLVGSR